MDPKDYEGREQALVKHTVLEGYLRALALKVAQFRPGTTLNYVDGFSGPYDHGVPLESNRPTSPHIALSVLRDVREQLRHRRIALDVRGLFVEADPQAFVRLDDLCAQWRDVTTVRVAGEFEAHIDEVAAFAAGGAAPFSFVFIDPTGWTGFGLRRITPLLRVKPGEVLVNFMLKDILRFVDDERPEIRAGFEDLFGTNAEAYRHHWRGLQGTAREEAIVRAYCERVRDAGGYAHCVSTVVMNPLKDRTHYHLVYGTRSTQGLITFRQIEKTATALQRDARAVAKQAARTKRTGQGELFGAATMETAYVDSLASRYRDEARRSVEERLREAGMVAYDTTVSIALAWPLVSEAELKAWIKDWVSGGRVTIEGLAAGARVPVVARGHRLRWQG